MSSKGMKIQTHRGRTKDGKKPVRILLTQDEYDLLIEEAERNFRTAVSHAAWLVTEGCRKGKEDFLVSTNFRGKR